MCDPTGGVATALLVASTVASAGTAIYTGVQQNKAEKYQAGVDRNNAIYADREAASAMDRANEEQVAHYRKLAALRGEQRASMAAGGLDLGLGSPADALADTSVLGNEDAARLSANGAQETMGYRINAQNYRSSASAHKMAGTQALVGGYLKAGSTLLDGASSMSAYKAKYGGPGGSASKSLRTKGGPI